MKLDFIYKFIKTFKELYIKIYNLIELISNFLIY